MLRRMLTADRINSLIFYGPPGSGKTALAHVIAQHTHCVFLRPERRGSQRNQGRFAQILEEAAAELETSGRRTNSFRR